MFDGVCDEATPQHAHSNGSFEVEVVCVSARNDLVNKVTSINTSNLYIAVSNIVAKNVAISLLKNSI